MALRRLPKEFAAVGILMVGQAEELYSIFSQFKTKTALPWMKKHDFLLRSIREIAIKTPSGHVK